MDWNYWLIEINGTSGVEFGCVYARSLLQARDDAGRRFGKENVARDPEPVAMDWFHYEPLVVASHKLAGREVVSLRGQFYAGGCIGCEAGGLEIMFTPDLLPEPKMTGEGEESTVTYGNALLRVKGRPDLDAVIEMEGLDDAHLIDRLSSEVAIAVGRARNSPSVNYGRTPIRP